MLAKVVGIGNSAGIVIPASLLASLGLRKNDRVSIEERRDGFLVKKAEEPPKTFAALLEEYYSLPADRALERFREEGDDAEPDWGESCGEEL